MGRTLSILGIIAAVLGAMTALMLVDLAAVVVGVFAVGAGIFVAISRDWRRWATGGSAILMAVLGILGVLGSIGGENTSLDAPFSAAIGYALIVAATLEISGAAVLLSWGHFQPEWISYVWAGLWAVAFVLAFVLGTQLGDQTQAGAFVVAVVVLANMGAPMMQILHKE